MADLLVVFACIIDFDLLLISSNYNFPVNDWHEVEYHTSAIDSLVWRVPYGAVI